MPAWLEPLVGSDKPGVDELERAALMPEHFGDAQTVATFLSS
jgi:hypothetical protein